MELLFLGVVSLLASILTFYTGFGLGTILMPTMALFFDLKIAILYTAIVHFLNNTYKSILMNKSIDYSIFLRFGIPALLFALIGSYLLNKIDNIYLFDFSIHNLAFHINLLGLVIGLLIIIFEIIDLFFRKRSFFSKKYLPFGGILSGFFGGLSGHQGAFRSMFLIKVIKDKYTYIATGTAISLIIDIARITIYIKGDIFSITLGQELFVSLIAALLGVIIGKKLLAKIEIKFVKIIVTIFIFAMAIKIIFTS